MRDAEWFQGQMAGRDTVCVFATVVGCIFLPYWASLRSLNDSQKCLLASGLALLSSVNTSSLPLPPVWPWLLSNHHISFILGVTVADRPFLLPEMNFAYPTHPWYMFPQLPLIPSLIRDCVYGISCFMCICFPWVLASPGWELSVLTA